MVEGDPELHCRFFDEPYTNIYPMRGGSHKARALKFEICHRTAVCSPVFVEQHNLEMFAALPEDSHFHYVSVSAFLQNVDAPCMLCVLLPPMFAYYSSAFGDNAPRLGHSLLEISMTWFTIMSFVCCSGCALRRNRFVYVCSPSSVS